jgi:valyl-tRNA synthetase
MNHNPEDDGLARIGNAYLMVRSPAGGALHAINPKTKKTYCGRDMLKLWNKWRPIDQTPDDKHQPTCKICQRHYDDPIRESLRQIAEELKESIAEFLFLQVHTKNSDGGLGRFVETYAKFVRSEYVKAKIRQELEKKEKVKS